MPDILIRGYKAKEQIEEIIEEARYAANNCMIGSGLEIIELPAHGDLIERDKAIESAMRQWISVKAYDELLASPVIVPASEEVES